MQLSLIFPGTAVICEFYPDWLLFRFEGQTSDGQAIISIGETGIAYVPIETLSVAKQIK